MNHKLRIWLMALAVIGVLAATTWVGMSLLNPVRASLGNGPQPGSASEAGDKGQPITYDVVRATEMPATNPDLTGRLEQTQDNRLMVRPDSKGAAAPLVEVVVGGQTRLYRNATGDFVGTPPAPGATLQMRLAPYRLEQMAVGDRVIAWGEQRGSRLVAAVIMVETVTAAATP